LGGDFQTAGQTITSNPARLAGELLVEVPLTLLPIGPILKGAKASVIIGKNVIKQLVSHPDIISKATIVERKTIESVADKLILKGVTPKKSELEKVNTIAKKYISNRHVPGGVHKATPTIKQQEAKAIKELQMIANDPKSSLKQRTNALTILETFAKAGVTDRASGSILTKGQQETKIIKKLEKITNDPNSSREQQYHASKILETFTSNGKIDKSSTFQSAEQFEQVVKQWEKSNSVNLISKINLKSGKNTPPAKILSKTKKIIKGKNTNDDAFTELSKTFSSDSNINKIPNKYRKFYTYQDMIGSDANIVSGNNIHVITNKQLSKMNDKIYTKILKTKNNVKTLKIASAMNKGKITSYDAGKTKTVIRKIKEKIKPTNISSDIKIVNPEQHGFPGDPIRVAGFSKPGDIKSIYLNKFTPPGADTPTRITDTIIHEDVHNVLNKMGLPNASYALDNITYLSPAGVKNIKKTIGTNKQFLTKGNNVINESELKNIPYDTRMMKIYDNINADRNIMRKKQIRNKNITLGGLGVALGAAGTSLFKETNPKQFKKMRQFTEKPLIPSGPLIPNRITKNTNVQGGVKFNNNKVRSVKNMRQFTEKPLASTVMGLFGGFGQIPEAHAIPNTHKNKPIQTPAIPWLSTNLNYSSNKTKQLNSGMSYFLNNQDEFIKYAGLNNNKTEQKTHKQRDLLKEQNSKSLDYNVKTGAQLKDEAKMKNNIKNESTQNGKNITVNIGRNNEKIIYKPIFDKYGQRDFMAEQKAYMPNKSGVDNKYKTKSTVTPISREQFNKTQKLNSSYLNEKVQKVEYANGPKAGTFINITKTLTNPYKELGNFANPWFGLVKPYGKQSK
jgi:hypothetical protein